MFCEKHQDQEPPVECIVCLHERVRCLEHIVAVLKAQISMAYHSAKNIEADIRVHNGRLEAWCLGDWVDVEEANRIAECEDEEINE